jgi:hypothetical protein
MGWLAYRRAVKEGARRRGRARGRLLARLNGEPILSEGEAQVRTPEETVQGRYISTVLRLYWAREMLGGPKDDDPRTLIHLETSDDPTVDGFEFTEVSSVQVFGYQGFDQLRVTLPDRTLSLFLRPYGVVGPRLPLVISTEVRELASLIRTLGAVEKG